MRKDSASAISPSDLLKQRRAKSYPIRGALIILAGIGGAMTVLQGAWVYLDDSDKRRHAYVSSLPDLRSAPSGETGILEGRIAASVPPLHEEFVAYLRERYRSNSAGVPWVLQGGKVQPLTIETGAATVRVVNTDYIFDRAIDPWTAASRDESPPTFFSGTIRISGLVAGSPVMIVGHAAPGGAPGQIIAKSIAGVDRETYLDRLGRAQARGRPLSFWMMGLGLAGIAYAVWDGRRVLME